MEKFQKIGLKTSSNKYFFLASVTLNGVKTLVGDVLTLDNTFNKCIQKRVCEEFSYTEEHVEDFDPVKRSWSVQRRIKPGRLRWIGDMIATGLSKVARKVGFLPDPNRRNDGMMGNMEMVGKFATKKFEEIPMDRVQDVMDFTTDTTDIMDRKGNIYPLAKAAGLGYGIGHKKMVWEEDGDMQGCCTAQIGPDCGSFWHHLKEYNDYNYPDSRMMKPGGLLYLLVSAALSISQKAKKPHKSVSQSRSIDEQTYSSRTGKMIGPESEMDSIKGKIVDEELKKICDQRYFQNTNQSKVHKEYDQRSSDINGNIPNMQERKEKLSSPRVIQSASPNSSNQPIIVFEGLPPKFPDETEEELVGSILEQTIRIPKTSVIKALRMPMVSQSGHSLVMVQMDTQENEQKVLEKKSEIRSSDLNLDHVGIREMNDIMWWNLVQELTVVKRVVPLQERK